MTRKNPVLPAPENDQRGASCCASRLAWQACGRLSARDWPLDWTMSPTVGARASLPAMPVVPPACQRPSAAHAARDLPKQTLPKRSDWGFVNSVSATNLTSAELPLIADSAVAACTPWQHETTTLTMVKASRWKAPTLWNTHTGRHEATLLAHAGQ